MIMLSACVLVSSIALKRIGVFQPNFMENKVPLNITTVMKASLSVKDLTGASNDELKGRSEREGLHPGSFVELQLDLTTPSTSPHKSRTPSFH